MEFLLEEIGLSQFCVGKGYHYDRQTVLLLTLLNHLIELSPFYDLFLSILKIADNQYTFFSVHDKSFQMDIGCLIIAKDEQGREKDAPITQKRLAVKNFLLNFKKLQGLYKLFKKSFDIDVRNAFSHSQYKIQYDGVQLTHLNRSISYNELRQKTFGAFYIVTWILRFIERIRDEFIKSGCYIGEDYKIIPKINDNRMGLRVEF